jgi:hypothetical protein
MVLSKRVLIYSSPTSCPLLFNFNLCTYKSYSERQNQLSTKSRLHCYTDTEQSPADDTYNYSPLNYANSYSPVIHLLYKQILELEELIFKKCKKRTLATIYTFSKIKNYN